MLEKVIIVVVVAVVVLAAGVAWWFENGSASHNEGGHAADVDSNELTKLENKYIMKEGMFLCGNIPFSCAFLCVLGTYREKVSQKVSVKVAGGTYVEKVH